MSSCSDQSEEEVDEEDIEGIGGHKKSKKVNKNDEEVRDEGQLSAEDLKQKADSLWDEFQKDLPKDKSNDGIVSEATTQKKTITKTYDFAGEEVKVIEEVAEEVANTSKAEAIEDKSNDKTTEISTTTTKEVPIKGVKRTGGLGSVLSQLKKPKIGTLQKSAIDWTHFKQKEGIAEELDLHNRSKDTFIERQAFLQRTDLRQFEREKQIREKNRSQRQLNKD